MLGCCSESDPYRGAPALDPRGFRERGMDDRVRGHLNDHRVRKVDYCFNGCGTVVGIALIVVSVALFLITQNAFGWSGKLTFFYVLYGGIGVAGGLLTVLSIRWMIQSCQKSFEYDRMAYDALRS